MKRLHKYLTGDLAKATVMAALAFTLLMTVVVIIEPMRKRGLGPGQVLSLFAYTLPVMLSFTLPIAAVFAATLVYGRFSQDNELTACRASGVSTLNLLRPALGLGAAVTLLALILGNFVAPALAGRAGKAILSSAHGYVFNVLKRRGTIKFGQALVRGDQPDLENERIVGVVVLYLPDDAEIAKMLRQVRNLEVKIGNESDPARQTAMREKAASLRARVEAERHDVRLFAASSAEVLGIRATADGEILVSVATTSPLTTEPERMDMAATDSGVFELPPFENPGEEDSTWFGWGRLIAILEEPSTHNEIQRQLQAYRHEIGKSMLHQRVVETIGRDEPYAELRSADGRDTFRIWAPRATWDRKESGVQLMDAVDENNRRRPVTVEVFRDGQRYRTVTAAHWYVTADFSEMYARTAVTILLAGSGDGGEPVWLYEHEIGGEPVNIDQWRRDGLPLPLPIGEAQERIDLKDLCYDPESYTGDPDILAQIGQLRERDMPNLVLDVIAEMHKRIAYGASCFMMVAMGAALGLTFRGGQVVQAFALAIVPAALVIIMVYMGGEMIRNVSVPTAVGVASLWSGIGLITLGNVMLYGRLARR